MGYGDFEENKNFTLVYPFQDVLMKATESMKNQDYLEYIDIVEHLRNMTILTFSKEDVNNIARIEDVIEDIKQHIDMSFKQNVSSSSLYRVEEVNTAALKSAELRRYCEFLFFEVIERICIHSLRKTLFNAQVRSSQQSDVFDAGFDITRTVKKMNGVFRLYGIAPFEGIV